jgi:hypothetical protein
MALEAFEVVTMRTILSEVSYGGGLTERLAPTLKQDIDKRSD